MTLGQRLDPRRHLAAAIGWAAFVLVTLSALLAANLAAREAEQRARADAQALLVAFSMQIRGTLAANLDAHRATVRATAAQIVASTDHGGDAIRRHLEAVMAQFPEFIWLGAADGRGRVAAATAGAFEGQDVTAMDWFKAGKQQPYLGMARSATSIEAAPMRHPAGSTERFVDLSAPLRQVDGRTVGVVGAYLSWSWIERLLDALVPELAPRGKLELLLADGSDTVIVGPVTWLGRKLDAASDLSERGRYLVDRSRPLALVDPGGPAWTIVLRQSAEVALAPARSTRTSVFATVFLIGLLAAAAFILVARALTRRLAALATEAQAVRDGRREELDVPEGIDEVSRIGATLAEVFRHLQREKQALQALNAELDARVAERTARVEQLAEESSHAAVTRERLRMARDLHDTLAHSLMALLTQIRLARKLHHRLDFAEMDAELGRAEDVAATGLVEARRAITQMRSSGVREYGLGPSVQQALAKLEERSGVAVSFVADPELAAWAAQRAETVFRIVEEALRNIERHAQAHEVRVTLQWVPSRHPAGAGSEAPRRARVTIVDDGVGFDPAQPRPGHFGVRGMVEQASLLQAQLDLHSAPGAGTRVALTFDL